MHADELLQMATEPRARSRQFGVLVLLLFVRVRPRSLSA